MPIHLLSPDLAAKIAAGEVIERPVSVVKELVENSIDAGASDIQVEIALGGRRLIRVSDNGCGIAPDQVQLAFARHATSKLDSAEDLYRLQTLGFRGEALASIAAVSQLTFATRSAEHELGTVLRLEAGVVSRQEPQGRPPGTMVQVENLFYNMPARLKFLRADRTEAGHTARLISSYAMAYPETRFELQHNDRLVLRTAGSGSLYDVLIAIYGLDVAEQMIQLPESAGQAGVRVQGYIGMPSLQRANRQDLVFFVNRRWIQDSSLAFAVTEAYRTLMPQGRHPVVVLSILLPPEEVDVNIHPTKREVRFRQSRDVFSAVQRVVRMAIMAQHPVPQVFSDSFAPNRHVGVPPHLGQTPLQMDLNGPGALSRMSPLSDSLTEPHEDVGRLPMLRVLGQIAQTYIIAEGPGGMYLVDQHAAHERIRYEQLKAQLGLSDVASQELLDPMPLELSPRQATLLEDQIDLLATWGLEIMPFGGTTFLLKRVPASLVGLDLAPALVEMLDAALEGGEGFSWKDQALITLSCHTAVRAGQTLSLEEMRDLVRQLEQCELPHTCPHGRPTIIQFTHAELEKQFGRR